MQSKSEEIKVVKWVTILVWNAVFLVTLIQLGVYFLI